MSVLKWCAYLKTLKKLSLIFIVLNCIQISPSSAVKEKLFAECGIVHKFEEPIFANSSEIGAKNIYYGKYPWHVGIFVSREDEKTNTTQYHAVCNGFLIAPETIITNAHCLKHFGIESYSIGAGKLIRLTNVSEPYQQYRKIKRITFDKINPPDSHENDIAIVDVNKAFDINNFVGPVCIDGNINSILSENIVRIAGWSHNYVDGKPNNHLQEIDLPIIDVDACKKKFPNHTKYLSYDKFCAIYKDGKIGPREGSSGSAATIQKDDIHYVYGFISSQVNIDTDDSSTLTNINIHLNMIKDHLKSV